MLWTVAAGAWGDRTMAGWVDENRCVVQVRWAVWVGNGAVKPLHGVWWMVRGCYS